MPSINSSVSIDPTRLQRAVAVAEDAVRSGPYPSAVIAVATAEAMILTRAVSHRERAPAREDSIFLLASMTFSFGFQSCLDRIGMVRTQSTIYNRVPFGRICNCKEELWVVFCLDSGSAW